VFVELEKGARQWPRTRARKRLPDFFVASRAHHADIGGAYAGSMGLCREIYQEGVRIPPLHLVRGGEMQNDVLRLLLNNVRTPEEREGDLRAQLAACHTGATRLRELCLRHGVARVRAAQGGLLDYSEELTRALLRQVAAASYEAEDFLDDDGISDAPVRIRVKITFRKEAASRRRKGPLAIVDFTGSSPQVAGSINAVEAITYSACFYVFRCLLAEDVPAAAGLMRPIRVIAPLGTVVNARPPAAVAGGNVETSQRIVDVLLRALAQAFPERIPAAAAGTMNNLTIGGMDPRTGEPFAYYETIAGGMGSFARLKCSPNQKSLFSPIAASVGRMDLPEVDPAHRVRPSFFAKVMRRKRFLASAACGSKPVSAYGSNRRAAAAGEDRTADSGRGARIKGLRARALSASKFWLCLRPCWPS
jgi:N-methylhydantoinase B